MVQVLRLLLYLLKKLLIALVVVGLMAFVFSYCMDIANVYILAKDGMEARAEVSLTLKDGQEMTKFFSGEYASAYLENESIYTDYEISSIDHRVEIEKLTCLSWKSTAEAIVTEQIPVISGYLPIAKQNAEQLANPNKILPPAWQGGRYRISMIKIDSMWKITNVERLEYLAAQPTPTPRPLDAATPVPVPTDTPKPVLPILSVRNK